jgi:ATP-dependent helicase/nuclease subunit B
VAEFKLPVMLQREFLGWDKPFLMRAAEWLLGMGDRLPGALVVVPTSEAGRRLREALAEIAGAVMSPRITTPGRLLRTQAPEIAADWIEKVAWMETLEGVRNWSDFAGLFPQVPPGDVGEWAPGLSGELLRLRRALQENGLTLAQAATRLGASVEGGRWSALGRLESLMEARLRSWGFLSRSRVLADGIAFPEGITSIILAGVTDLPPLLERSLMGWDGPVHVWIGAPECEADGFSETGRPLAHWSERAMPWPDGDLGSVTLVADHRQEAIEALRRVVERQTPSNEVALGSPDTATGDEVAGAFTRAGWTAFHPAALTPPAGLSRWLRVWSLWMADPRLAVAADLFGLPETGGLIGGYRGAAAERLSRLRNDWMVLRADDLRLRIASAVFRSEDHRMNAERVLRAVESLERWRMGLLRAGWEDHLRQLLGTLGAQSSEHADEAASMVEWLDAAAPVIRRSARKAGFWIDLMLASLPKPAPQPPPGRVVDVQGWLELFFEPGSHLVLCGMNEGKVPAASSSDPWLGENASRQLGLVGNAERAARDSFLYQAMTEARRDGGRVDVICAKTGAGGEALLPSRLLLAADRAELPARVKFLFREIEPPEAGLRWHADWAWQPRKVAIPRRLAVTSLSTYLACPFRFYLKHAVGMQAPEPARIEWNARDFGTVAHDVLERWGRDPEARELNKAEALHAWLSAELERVVDAGFGKAPPLAVRIQTEALLQRFAWFARVQACSRAEGWELVDVEHKFELPFSDSVLVAKIDRIDRHRETGVLRVIDYKTGKVKSVEAQHRRKVSASTTLPAHIDRACAVIHSGSERGKPVDFRWINLQLPLYALAMAAVDPQAAPPVPCYFTLGATEADVAIEEWTGFSAADLEAAQACAGWIVGKIASGEFWPPAERVDYDDYAILGAGKPLAEAFHVPSME